MTIFLVTGLAFLLTGCQRAPSFNIGGAYFPAWLVFALASVVVTLVVRGVLIRLGVDDALRYKPVLYIGLMVMFCLAALLLFFAY
nr:YtcA family lipoprotein [Paenalcaligenes hominis]